MANIKKGNMEKIIISVAVLVPVLSFIRKKIGRPTTRAMEKQISCLLVRLNITLVFTVLKSFGIGTYAIKYSFYKIFRLIKVTYDPLF
jgi:hypothetical protein